MNVAGLIQLSFLAMALYGAVGSVSSAALYSHLRRSLLTGEPSRPNSKRG